MRIACLLAILSLAACNTERAPGPDMDAMCAEATCSSAPARDVLAVDGDTFELRSLTIDGETWERLRLIGWDSPETGEAAGCLAEDVLGSKVESEVRALFSEGETVTFLTEGRDQYGRTRAHIWLDGVHVGWLLEGAGLAQKLEGNQKPDWCA